MPAVGFEPTISVFECAKTFRALESRIIQLCENVVGKEM
jgi:hypothetical protein